MITHLQIAPADEISPCPMQYLEQEALLAHNL
ncbi:hypothetical protein TIFTF001_055417 [Ficus carica]|uniref:Uncharacterized protein n=1 Tax=Ficus carica TaxID=3494 RepID=A0AA88EHW0_FICCA|nr:hypothetical protein TIFTF001_055417 [Ficus carica]